MRVYHLPINAEILEVIMPINDVESEKSVLLEINNLLGIMHGILETELYVKTTGALPSAVQGRGHTYKIGDLW